MLSISKVHLYHDRERAMGMNNIERRNQGLIYHLGNEVIDEIGESRKRLQRLNQADWSDFERLRQLTADLLGHSEGALITPPFFCDYGTHISVGKNFFANFNCTILDVAKVTIGDNCFMAPNVAIYTAAHPIHPAVRNAGFECAREVTIGDNVCRHRCWERRPKRYSRLDCRRRQSLQAHPSHYGGR